MRNNYFKYTLFFIILAELLSIFAWLLPRFNIVCFGVILAITLILSFKKLQYGIFIALSELIIGSQGYLFSFERGNTLISIRIGIFMVVMFVWLIKVLTDGGVNQYFKLLKQFRFYKYYFYLALVLIWGLVWGLIRGNDFGNIFLDFNNWLFFLYLLPLLSVVKSKDFWRNFFQVALAALSWLIIKTLFFLYIFSHQFIWALPELYNWIRDTRVGEITMMSNNFYRIFLQSQVFALLGFFILLPSLGNKINKNFIIIVGFLTSLIVSFSRSFWIGLLAGLFFYYIYAIYQLRLSGYKLFKKFFIPLAKLFILVIFSLGSVFAIINLPPKISGEGLGSLISKRTTQIEASGSSRINMLKPLGAAIIRHPLIGSGFGASLTYRSLDPRVLSLTAGASGLYTTYAFEWSYLDLLLKIGLIGLLVYLVLIFKILHSLWQFIKFKILNNNSQLQTKNYPLQAGFFLALISLLSLNIFTPYLNHPLGIGFILLASVFADSQTNQ